MRGVSIAAEINGQPMTSLRALAKHFGVPQRTIHYRWMRGKRGLQLIAPSRNRYASARKAEASC